MEVPSDDEMRWDESGVPTRLVVLAIRGSLMVLKSLSFKSSNPAGESLLPFILNSDKTVVDFIFVRNLAGERDRLPAEWDRL